MDPKNGERKGSGVKAAGDIVAFFLPGDGTCCGRAGTQRLGLGGSGRLGA
ncbi:MAG TPA: hypothetical protein VGE77_01090 [Nocardioides sp.]